MNDSSDNDNDNEGDGIMSRYNNNENSIAINVADGINTSTIDDDDVDVGMFNLDNNDIQENNNISSPTTPGTNAAISDLVGTSRPRSAKRLSPGETTARKKKAVQGATKIKLGCRVHTMRKQIFHILNQQQKECLKGFKDTYRLYGTVVSGN